MWAPSGDNGRCGPVAVFPSGVTPPNRDAQRLSDRELVFTLQASRPLPHVDLSKTALRALRSEAFHGWLLQFMRLHYHHLVMVYRIGTLCFIGLFFLDRGVFHSVLASMMLPSSFSVIATAAFISTDIARLLTKNYEFCFTTAMNAINWLVLGIILADARALMCFPAWVAFQTVILVDANVRTFPTAVKSMMLSLPVMLAVGFLVACRAMVNINVFDIVILGHKHGDAGDLLFFTSTTLVLFLGKIVIPKKKRYHQSYEGYTTIPCVVVKATLRFVAVENVNARRIGFRTAATLPPNLESVRGSPHLQTFTLAGLPLSKVDARNTILPSRIWLNPPHWLRRRRRGIRMVFYATGCVGYACSLSLTILIFQLRWSSHEPSETTTTSQNNRVLEVLAFLCTCAFCGTCAMFYQKDILRVLISNFDFAFSSVQAIAYAICICDMLRWNADRTAVVVCWGIWFHWALTLDALLPIFKRQFLGISKRIAAPIMATILLASAGVMYVQVFLPEFLLHDRVIWTLKVSSTTTVNIHTSTILVGRVITLLLWCIRQVYRLLTRKEDELNLIRGFVEYLSPYETFPCLDPRVREGTAAARAEQLMARQLAPPPRDDATIQ